MASQDSAGVLHALVDHLTILSKSYDGASSNDVEKRTAMGGVAKQIVTMCMDQADMSSYHSVQVGNIHCYLSMLDVDRQTQVTETAAIKALMQF
jgi:hypothetical protein